LFWSASGLPELWIASERDTWGRLEWRVPERASSKAAASDSTPNLGGGCLCFGVLPAWRSFGSRRSGNTWERLGGRVPERASSKAAASDSTPNLGGGAAVFWSASGLAELWITSEREHVGAAGRACSRACVIQSGRERASASTPNLGGGCLCFGVLPACRSFGLRRSGNTWERLGGRVPERASSKAAASARAPALKLGWRVPLFWSASGLPEPWITSEREHVGAAGRACSRACVIQSGRERQHSKLG